MGHSRDSNWSIFVCQIGLIKKNLPFCRIHLLFTLLYCLWTQHFNFALTPFVQLHDPILLEWQSQDILLRLLLWCCLTQTVIYLKKENNPQDLKLELNLFWCFLLKGWGSTDWMVNPYMLNKLSLKEIDALARWAEVSIICNKSVKPHVYGLESEKYHFAETRWIWEIYKWTNQ